ncbi:MAG: PD40 domain-containing protein [Rhizobacter sp.]|nr:PD40 domain-containing protein [Rhizobacter sp.]
MKEVLTRVHSLACVAAAATAVLAGCGSGSSDTNDKVVVQGDVPIAYVKRSASINMNPTGGAPYAPGGDLMIRDLSSGSATERNVTEGITQGRGDASDPEVSYDGKKIVFSLKCPTSNTSTINGQPACTGAWNIWEYDMSAGVANGTFRRITSSSSNDDVDPAYLPNGQGFVFSSNRQTTSRLKQGAGPAGGYFAADEYERERVFNLHTMDANGGNIKQISVNQSHDRNPVVRPNGDIMFSRWDHVAMRNHFKVFRVKPDGTDMFVIYGAHSEGNSFLHPRDMDPSGPYAGQITSDLMPLQRTHEGGALVFVDAANYSEQNTPVSPQVAAQGGQRQVTKQTLEIDRGISLAGRITTPYPLWDGTNRVLVAWTACQLTENGETKLCSQFTPDQLAAVSDRNMTAAQAASAPIRDNARPAYGIFMFDPAKQEMRPVAAPPAGFMYTDPIALQARPEPNAAAPASIDPTLAGAGMGVLEVRSVYDTDGLGRMGDPVILAADRQNGCTNPIPKTTPSDPLDTRAQIADIVKLKDPADPAYGCAPARFIRVMRAVPPPSGMMGLREAIGETDFEPQAILGYAPIEPDGSFKLKVPADVPLGLAVVDAKGRAFQTHTNWIQVRPGETRTCDGCHSPRRGGSINSGVVAQTMPAALLTALQGAPGSLGTLASRRASVDPTTMDMKPDMVFTDVWADTSKGGVPRADLSLKYKGNPNPADDMQTLAPGENGSAPGMINYPDHIAPLWSLNRGGNTCTTCHNDPTKLDLSATIAGTGRMQSYERLMIGDPVIDQGTGLPTFHLEDGVPVIDRLPALVSTDASEGDAMGLSRKSRLAEILFGEDLASGQEAHDVHPTPALDHSTMLTAGEKRLVAEWIDLGGKYYNDLFASGVTQVAKLTQASFESTVYPIILANCASACHQAIGSTATPAGTNFRQNRYVLTGDAEGDFNSTLTMISNVCAPASNYLLSRPSTAPHPAAGTGAILPVGSANYNAIANWIAGGC